ncbi:hypothetical protein CJ255_17250 [Candidatus Viridilinea mediisalina]|uniref:Uncharacterized protein n=1 Tax=Candidatus Viridilinea mediisalina TaxID=2024553 RepID=A0A2A6RFZ8_9CHLR|nr:hypothetical protein CJ255_17250 [Candidatus Viridilinea mediisalina]
MGVSVLGDAVYSRVIGLLPTSYFLLPTSCFLLPTSYFLLPTSYFLLPTSYFLLPTSYFLLPASYFLLPTLLHPRQLLGNHALIKLLKERLGFA